MNNIISEIRKRQNEMVVMINSTFDDIVERVEHLSQTEMQNISYEVAYPLTNTAGFKGTKVIAVMFGTRREIAHTWKEAVELILKDAMKDKTKNEAMINLCDKILGRKRVRLSSSSKDMRSPLKLQKDLYIETHYDTETLLNLLLQILNAISYDYTDIKLVIKNN